MSFSSGSFFFDMHVFIQTIVFGYNLTLWLLLLVFVIRELDRRLQLRSSAMLLICFFEIGLALFLVKDW